MGALTGNLSLRRYRVMGRPTDGFRDRFAKGVQAHALIPLDPHKDAKEERSVGWCSIYDENDLDLSFDKFHLDGHIVLALRVDVLRPSPAEVKRQVHLRKLDEEQKRKAPLSKAAVKDLREQVIAELRKKTAPQTRTTDMVWHLEAETAYFFAQAGAANELFVELFAKTFGMALDVEGPGAWAADMAAELGLADDLRGLRPSPPLLGGFAGLRPGTRTVDELLRMENN